MGQRPAGADSTAPCSGSQEAAPGPQRPLGYEDQVSLRPKAYRETEAEGLQSWFEWPWE